MSRSNYPSGFVNGLTLRGLPIQQTHPGEVFWVSNAAAAQLTGHRTGSDGNAGTFTAPFATLDYAIGKCVASRGDIIIVKQGHAETLSAAAAIAADVAGIAILGLGHYNSRPTFTLDTATSATLTISAANITLANLLFKANFADIVTCLNITAKGARLIGVEFADTAVDMNFLTPIKATSTTDNNADGLSVLDCRWISIDAASLEFIEINANLDGFVAEDNFVQTAGTAAPFFLSAGTKVMTGMKILRNYLQNANTANDLAWDNGGSTNSGIIAHNRIGHADVTGAHVLGAVAGARLFDNLSVSTDALSGFVLPAIDVDL